MNKLRILVLLSVVTVMLSGCLKSPDKYMCDNNKRTSLSFQINNSSVTPDDYASGAVVRMNETDSIAYTIVEMSLMNSNNAYVLFIQMDSAVAEGISYQKETVKDSYISIGDKKYPITIDMVKFTELNGSVASNYTNLFYYDNARGSFSGTYLKDGDTDSTSISGTFCYDDSPEKR